MDRRRWRRTTKVAVVLAVVTMLIWLSALVSASPDTLTIRPNAAGDEANLGTYPGTGEAHWEDVDEAISDGDTTHVDSEINDDTYRTDLHNLADTTVSGKGKITSVTVWINARAILTPTQPSAYTRIKTNAVAYDGSPETLGTAYAPYSTAYPTNPQTTNEWTWLEINNLQAGVALRRGVVKGAQIDRHTKCTQVWVVVDYTPATLESYDDDIQSNVWGTVADPYDDTTQTAYIYGSNFIASHGYTVGYYDGDGTKTASESVISAADNTLSSQYLLSTDINAIAGTWHAVVFDNDLGSPSDNYTDASTTDGYMVEDAFKVTNAAIPEFPVVIAGIVVVGTCFGIYYWMRQRRLAYVKVKA